MRNPNTFTVAATILAAFSIASSCADQIAYDNTSNFQQSVHRGNLEYGDQVTLTTGQALVNGFEFEYNFTGLDGEAGAVVRFWDMSGGNGFLPGNLLYESTQFPLFNGFASVHITDFQVLVPATFAWTVDFGGIDGSELGGLLFYNGVPINNGPGGSTDDYFENTSATATPVWSRVQYPGVIDNFGARVTVVPEPGTVAMLAAGGILLALSARRRK